MLPNLWILTEERPKISVLNFILGKLKTKLSIEISIDNLQIKPVFNNHIFLNYFIVSGFKSKDINSIKINLISSGSSFVDYLIFFQEEKPSPNQLLENCIFAIEETKTNSYDSRNTAMGQRSAKFNTINYYILKYGFNTQPVMYYSHKQAEIDHDSVAFINRLMRHLETNVEFWGKDINQYRPFKSLSELIEEKNKISSKNTRKNDTPMLIKIKDNKLYLKALLANPGQGRKNYTGRIQHDPNMGQIPLIAKGIRRLGWEGEIIVTDHQIKESKIKGNKFTNLANLLKIDLENCKIPKTNFNDEYWEYEKTKEKVSTILVQIILENNGMKTIFDNHGGCEKSFFKIDSENETPINKKFSKDGGKIPDLVILDNFRKIIYQFEGKKSQYLGKGLTELSGFELFENMYLKKYYPYFSYERGLIIMGGNYIQNDKIYFQLLSDNRLICKLSRINF